MASPYEDPRKKKLRERAISAIDAAGYDIEDPPEDIALPENAELQGSMIGDIQALDSDGNRHVYFVRVDADKPLPEWLAKFARIAHELKGIKVHVLVEGTAKPFLDSAKSAGAGIIRVENDHTCTVLVAFDDFDPKQIAKEFAAKMRDLRRRLDAKDELLRQSLETNFATTDGLTRGMPDETRRGYLETVEAAYSELRTWRDEISARLDAVAVTLDKAELDAIEGELERDIGKVKE